MTRCSINKPTDKGWQWVNQGNAQDLYFYAESEKILHIEQNFKIARMSFAREDKKHEWWIKMKYYIGKGDRPLKIKFCTTGVSKYCLCNVFSAVFTTETERAPRINKVWAGLFIPSIPYYRKKPNIADFRWYGDRNKVFPPKM